MDDVIKIIIGNGGLSVNSGVLFFNVVNCTLYNEGYIQVISDTSSSVGSVEHAMLVAIAYFANKNLK